MSYVADGRDHASSGVQGLPHVNHSEPVETLPTIKEGTTMSNGSAVPGVRNRGHSDLEKDGQGHALYPNATTQGTLYPQTTAKTDGTASSAGHSSKLFGVRSALGLHSQAPIDEGHDSGDHSQYWWPKVRLAMREPFAEFWGVFILVAFGNGSVAQVLLSQNQLSAPGGSGFGEYQSISWGWGLGTMLGIYVAGDSGAYLNPAITLANCVYRGLPFRRFPMYLLAQYLGGFVAAGVVYANYISSIDNFAGQGVRTSPPAPNATAAIFCTFPAGAWLNTVNQFFSEFIASTILMFVIFGLKDASNAGGIRGDGNWFPLSLFFLIFGLGACFGFETGYAINLARDFGPRCMAALVGYSGVWSAGNYYFWIPIIAPFCGCLFGGFLYDVFIYTGPESPINTPYMGLPYLLRPDRYVRERWDGRVDAVPGGAAQGYVAEYAPEQKERRDGVGAAV